MSAILLALGSAVAYGTTDFLAGWLSRRSHYARVSLVAQVTAAIGAVIASAIVGGDASGSSLLWGALSGLGGGLGTLALYRGLARGRMNVVAPLSGVLCAGLPALLGLALGDQPSAAALAGLVLALPAVWLTARAGDPGPGSATGTPAGVFDGLLAGAGFAVLFIGLQRGGRGVGLWPTAASQVVAALPMAWLYVRKRAAGAVDGPPDAVTRLGPVLGGILVALGATLYFLATRRGLLTVVAVLASLYPVVTVVLARWLLAERIGRWQGMGLVLAGIAVALISAG